MYNGDFIVEQPTLRPNYSIDLVIERVHVVAGSVNELTHVAENHVKQVATKGEDILSKFDVHLANTSSNVDDMIQLARDRFYGIPVDVFWAVLICALIAIGLGLIYLLLFGTHHILRRRKNYRNMSPRQQTI